MILNNEKKLNPTTKTAGVEQEFQKIAGKEASSVLQELGCTTNGIMAYSIFYFIALPMLLLSCSLFWLL